MAQRGDESHVPLIALRSILLSLRSGGLTFKERAKVKADERVAVREGEEKKAAQEASEKVRKDHTYEIRNKHSSREMRLALLILREGHLCVSTL